MSPPNGITDPAEIQKLVDDHGRWWHEIELAPGIVCFAPNMRALEVALQEAQFQVEESRSLKGAGYARATAVVDDRAAKYQRLDVRLHEASFDSSVPYFLDEEGSVHTLTGRRQGDCESVAENSQSTDSDEC